MKKPVPSLYSCHIEYDYPGKHGDCVDLNTLDDTWVIYPHDCGFSVTKMDLPLAPQRSILPSEDIQYSAGQWCAGRAPEGYAVHFPSAR